MKNIILLGLIFSFFLSCKSDQTKTTPVPIEKKEVVNQKFSELGSFPNSSLQKLYSETTYIDYIFYDLPFSISQDDQPSINSNLKLISPLKLGPISANCKPIGREFFHIGGEVAFEADLYFQDGCYGYVFIDNKKPVFANKISESGMKFYSNIIAQADQIRTKAANGQ